MSESGAELRPDAPTVSSLDRLDSWKEIAGHLGRHVTTVQRWEKQEGLPVHRHQHNKLGTIYASRSEIDSWWRQRRSSLELPTKLPTEPPHQPRGRRSARTTAGVGVVLLLAFGAIVLGTFRGPRLPTETSRPIRLTSFEGDEVDPALSPDGRQLAFVWDGERTGGYDLYTQVVGGTSAVQLTHSGSICCPAWSPDGHSLAFVRLTEGEGTVSIIPAAGGPERRLATLRPWFGLALAWSPEGGRIVYPDRRSPNAPWSLVAVSLETLQTTPLTQPTNMYAGDAFPSYSPDGRTLAFSRVSLSGDSLPSDIYLVRGSEAEPHRVTFGAGLIGGLDWSPDGREIVYVGVRKGDDPRVWRVPVAAPAKPTALLGLAPSEVVAETVLAVSHALRLSVGRNTRKLAYVRGSYDTNIWKVTSPSGGRIADPKRIIASSVPDEAPQYDPDGKTIAFASSRSGASEIWTCRRDGSACSALTHAGVHSGTPRWSPDGRQIAFDQRPADQSDIFVLDIDSRQTRAVTTSRADDVVPSWSSDGRTIYFASNQTGAWQVWQTNTQDASVSQLTFHGGFAAFEGGDSVYYTKDDSPGLWRVPRRGGNESQVLPFPQCWGHWALTTGGVFFLNETPGSRTSLQFFRFASQQATQLFSLDLRAPCAESSLAASPDGRELAYVAVAHASDIMLADLP